MSGFMVDLMGHDGMEPFGFFPFGLMSASGSLLILAGVIVSTDRHLPARGWPGAAAATAGRWNATRPPDRTPGSGSAESLEARPKGPKAIPFPPASPTTTLEPAIDGPLRTA